MNESVLKYSSLLGSYLIVVSVLYMHGFWNYFDVNIFQYVSISDIILVALNNLIYALGIFVFISFVNTFFTQNILYPGDGANSPEGKFMNKIRPILIVLDLILIVLLVWLDDPDYWVLFIPFLISLPLTILITNNSKFLSFISHPSWRNIIVFGLIYFPIASFGLGKMEAENILENDDIAVKVVGSTSKLICSCDSKNEYLGKLGSHFFIYNHSAKDLYIIPSSEEIVLNKQ